MHLATVESITLDRVYNTMHSIAVGIGKAQYGKVDTECFLCRARRRPFSTLICVSKSNAFHNIM